MLYPFLHLICKLTYKISIFPPWTKDLLKPLTSFAFGTLIGKKRPAVIRSGVGAQKYVTVQMLYGSTLPSCSRVASVTRPEESY